MDNKLSLAELKEKRDKNNQLLEKARQRLKAAGNQIRADEKLLAVYTRKERTHRLCTRAGMLESFLKDPEALSNDQVMDLLRIAFEQNAVREALNRLLQEAYSGRSPGTTEE